MKKKGARKLVLGIVALGVIFSAGGSGEKEEPPKMERQHVEVVTPAKNEEAPPALEPEADRAPEPEPEAEPVEAPEPEPEAAPDSAPAAASKPKPEPAPSSKPEDNSKADAPPAEKPEEIPAPEPQAPPAPEPEPEPAPAPPPETPPVRRSPSGKERRGNWADGLYLGSLESDKYHDYECRAAKKILSENEIWFASEDEAKAAGYTRCGICW